VQLLVKVLVCSQAGSAGGPRRLTLSVSVRVLRLVVGSQLDQGDLTYLHDLVEAAALSSQGILHLKIFSTVGQFAPVRFQTLLPTPQTALVGGVQGFSTHGPQSRAAGTTDLGTTCPPVTTVAAVVVVMVV
jgi:hypothetical protein